MPAATVVADIVVDTVVVADIAEADTAAPVVGIGEAGTVALAVMIVYQSCSLYRLPSGHLSTHLHPSHNLPLGIMESHVFACMVHPKIVLFCTL